MVMFQLSHSATYRHHTTYARGDLERKPGQNWADFFSLLVNRLGGEKKVTNVVYWKEKLVGELSHSSSEKQ